MTNFPLYRYDSDPLRILSPRNNYQPVPRHPCSVGGTPDEPPPTAAPAPQEVKAAPPPAPPPPEEPVPAIPPEDAEAREPQLHEIVAAWMSAHWDTVSAMAQAGEAPERPVAAPEPEPPAAEPDPPPEPAYVAPEDRWTKWKMAQFLRHLAATQSVKAAAKAVGMSRQSAYKLRARLKGEPFDIAWEAAFRHGYDNPAHSALELALEGEEVPHYHKGELVGTHRKRNPALMVQLLRMRNQEGAPMLGRYGAAAEYWSEEWDRMIERVETGGVSWSAELAAMAPEDRAQLPDARREIDGFIRRNLPDERPGSGSR